MTELAPIATVLAPEDHHDSRLIRSVGRTVLSTEVRIADPDDRALPTGQTGEILVRGPTVMQGYWRRPELTAEVLRGGWMHTGDLGYLDDNGYLFVVDRLKDMIISGGENVASQEVENVLSEHPAVAECAVIGIPDPVWGEAVHAVVVLRASAAASEAELIAHCRMSLAAFKCPRGVTFRTEPMPLSGANKILKTVLRESLGAG